MALAHDADDGIDGTEPRMLEYCSGEERRRQHDVLTRAAAAMEPVAVEPQLHPSPASDSAEEPEMVSDEAIDVRIADRAALRTWLAEHATTSTGVWILYVKGKDRRLGYDDIVEEAIAHGWIDSLPRSAGDTEAKLYLAPRKRGSGWSRVNKERAERVEAAGLMTDAGAAVIERAKEDGSWNALDEVEDLVEPPDLAARLDAVPAARSAWDGFPRSTRRAILEWILDAKRPATREQRIATTVEEAAVGRRANQWRQPKGAPPPEGGR